MHAPIKIGIIGGTGLSNPDVLLHAKEEYVETPFGKPSDALISGTINNVPCVLLSRHGRGHDIFPSHVNYRANIWALKEAGCTHVLVSTACGSLQKDVEVGQLVILDQFIDRTTKRHSTFYDLTPGGPKGICHIPMDTPFCPKMRQILINTAQSMNLPYRPTGTTVCIEGPRFSSKAESLLFQSWGCHTVNMTTVPEVCLAKELGLCYAAVAIPTDYDCWYDHVESVSVEFVFANFRKNCDKLLELMKQTIVEIAKEDWTDHIAQQQELAKRSVF